MERQHWQVNIWAVAKGSGHDWRHTFENHLQLDATKSHGTEETLQRSEYRERRRDWYPWAEPWGASMLWSYQAIEHPAKETQKKQQVGLKENEVYSVLEDKWRNHFHGEGAMNCDNWQVDFDGDWHLDLATWRALVILTSTSLVGCQRPNPDGNGFMSKDKRKWKQWDWVIFQRGFDFRIFIDLLAIMIDFSRKIIWSTP